MYANILIREPIEKVIEDWDFLQEKVLSHFATFKPVGQNIYGVRRRRVSAQARAEPATSPGPATYLEKRPTFGTLILGPNGVEVKHNQDLQLSITPGGLPHHTPHSFGYWHINDMDELSINLPGTGPDDPGCLLLVMGVPREGESDRWAWYCEECLTLLFEQQYETGRLGFNGFWKAERDAVQAYNANPKHQVCAECGHENPLGYCWNPVKDSSEEKAARAYW